MLERRLPVSLQDLDLTVRNLWPVVLDDDADLVAAVRRLQPDRREVVAGPRCVRPAAVGVLGPAAVLVGVPE